VLQSSFSDSFCRASVVAAIFSWMQLSDHCLCSCVYCAECRGYCHSNAWLAELQTFNQTMLLGTQASAKLFIYNNYVSKCSLVHLICLESNSNWQYCNHSWIITVNLLSCVSHVHLLSQTLCRCMIVCNYKFTYLYL
jgi:hypothetical protein